MDDIVERLRVWSVAQRRRGNVKTAELLWESASEIERLRRATPAGEVVEVVQCLRSIAAGLEEDAFYNQSLGNTRDAKISKQDASLVRDAADMLCRTSAPAERSAVIEECEQALTRMEETCRAVQHRHDDFDAGFFHAIKMSKEAVRALLSLSPTTPPDGGGEKT